MRVLVLCEESQAVCKAFRERGHEAYSCDLMPCSGGHPEWHIQADAFKVLKATTGWDLIICHPPCTYLAVSGCRWLKDNPARKEKQAQAIDFAKTLFDEALKKGRFVALENPVGVLSTKWRKPTQYIEPYFFGDHARKKTGLWLSAFLPPLVADNIVDEGELWGRFSVGASAHYARDENGKILSWSDPRTAIIRSKTFPGIARAMAEQWGNL